MKKILIGTFVCLTQLINAQSVGDTISIQTFVYDTDTRDTVIDFSALNGFTFEKILMKYSIRCHDGLVSNGSNTNLGCGEWDYSCNTYIHDSTKIDSVLYKHNDITISNFSGSVINYTTQPTLTYYQFNQSDVIVNNIISENQFSLNNGASTVTNVIDASKNSGKSQFLFTATELLNAGFSAGNIDGMILNTLNSGDANFLRVNIKQTTAMSLDAASPDVNGYTNVFYSNYGFVTGNNRIQFHTPFTWNGTDNLIFEISYTNSAPTNDIQFLGENVSNLSVNANNNYHIDLTAQSKIDVTTPNMANISDELTVTFWAKGNTGVSTENTSIIHAIDGNNNRSLNVHLPWSNGRIYFDCGWLSNGYDRIDKAATVNDLEDIWNHWTFVKNTNSGIMKIYKNGQVWHTGTQKNNLIEIVEMVIGATNSGNYHYKGVIDELTIWNKELTQTEIQDWMNIEITASHPQYANLIAYYKMDNGSGSLLLEEKSSSTTNCSQYDWKFIRGNDITRLFKQGNSRPNITLLQGNYNLTINNTAVLDSAQNSPNVITNWSIVSHPNTLLNDEVVVVSEQTVWEAVDQNVYDENGTVINTIPVTVEGTSSTPIQLDYFKRYPSKYEIMSFVTPYGINLNLGPNGKTWTFDVTDYTTLFSGDKRMTIEMGAWQEDMDIEFLFIVGTPPRNVLDITQIWRPDSHNFTDINNDRYFAPKVLDLDANGDSFIIRTTITGHGQQGEFIPRNHMLNLNGGAPEFTWQVWKECAENPIYPQGGTWIYDRAGWCPGAPTDVHFSDVTPYVTNQTLDVDYNVAVASGDSRYFVNNQLVTYGAINHNLDVSVVEIREPSERIEFARFNSICNNPKVVIKNTGSTTLTSCKIDFWVNDSSTPYTHEWTGSLDFGETEIVTLSTDNDFWSPITPTNNVFHVEVYAPNNGVDDYLYNNFYNSSFTIPDVIPSDFILFVKTNNAGYENSYQLTDDAGNVVFSKSNLLNNHTYRDTLHLPLGCYNFRFNDTGDDGIAWWANNDGTGVVWFLDLNGFSINTFEPDYGDNINFNFTINFPLKYEELNKEGSFELYPNPAHNNFYIKGNNIENSIVKVFNSAGELVSVPNHIESNAIRFETEKIVNGIYFIQLNTNGVLSSFKVIIE